MPGTAGRYAVIERLSGAYPTRLLCRALGVRPSGYYAWLEHPLSARQQQDAQLLELIRQVYQSHQARYGSPRIHAELLAQNVHCSCKRVKRLMRAAGLQAQPRRRYVVTTHSSNTRIAPDLLERRFTPGAVAAWVADITCIHTGEGFLYLAVVLQLASRRVIGWSMAAAASGQLALDALQMALGQAAPMPGLIHHSDRGGHYQAHSYKELLLRYGIEASMSRKGDCYDNAVAESFFASLKRELVYVRSFATQAQARQQIFEYIEVFYNRERRHSSLGYLSPVAYEKINNIP
jgi:putative transposase